MFVITKLSLPGVVKIAPSIHSDERGFFTEIYNFEIFKELGIETNFVQDSTSYSKKNVVRGLHYQTLPHAQDKLVRCVYGSIYDVAADVDPSSDTYGEHIGVTLSADSHEMLFIPGAYAHGFCVLGNEAVVEYKLSDTHYPMYAKGVLYNDPVLSIDWPISNPILSVKDTQWKPLLPKTSIN